MKLNTIKNLFEYKDTLDIYENYIANAGQLQGLGLPDICIIYKRTPLGMFKAGFEVQSSFHFCMGICPTSQAEVSAYIQSLITNQEKDLQSKMFGKDFSIFKILYIVYDIFSKTLLVCQFEQLTEGISPFKTFGIQINKQCLQLTKNHWEGAYISSVLRALDSELKMPGIGRFFNQTNISNPLKLVEFIKKLIIRIQGLENQFQDINKIKSKSDIPPIQDILYYLNMPLYILSKHLNQTFQLQYLIDSLNLIEDNIICTIIKSLLYYDMKNYLLSLQELCKLQHTSNWFNLPKFIMANVLIKLKQYDQAFSLLKDLIVDLYDNQIIWILMSKIFRKQKQYQISLIMINKASNLTIKQNVKSLWNEMNTNNYRILVGNKNIQNPSQIDQLYKIIHPIKADKIESYVQLSGYPQIESLLVRPRIQNKKEQIQHLQKLQNKQEYKVNPQTYEQIMNNDLLELEQEQNNYIIELIKIINILGYQKMQKYISQYFAPQQKNLQKQIDSLYDPTEFQIKSNSNKNLHLEINSINNNNINKSMCNPRLLDDIEDNESDDEEPNFLPKPNCLSTKFRNKSFDSTNVSVKYSQTPQSKGTRSPSKFSTSKKKQSFTKKANTIIVESAFESLGSERQVDQFNNLINRRVNTQQNEMLSQAPKSGQDAQPLKIQIHGLLNYLNPKITQNEQVQMNEQLKKRKETITPQLNNLIDTIIKVQLELDILFYPSLEINKNQINLITQANNQINQQSINSQAGTTLFKANLQKTIINKQHLDKQVEFKEHYIVQTLEDDNDKEKTYIIKIKGESMFLYKCARLAALFKRIDLTQQILEKLNSKIISVQISALMFATIKDNNKLLIKQIQRILSDFQECGISVIGFVPLWIEKIIINMTMKCSATQILSLLSNSESDFTFYLIKKIILTTENLA